ncbi:TPA: hypothetical protein ACX6SO_003753 [Photobacterium damselae]
MNKCISKKERRRRALAFGRPEGYSEVKNPNIVSTPSSRAEALNPEEKLRKAREAVAAKHGKTVKEIHDLNASYRGVGAPEPPNASKTRSHGGKASTDMSSGGGGFNFGSIIG